MGQGLRVLNRAHGLLEESSPSASRDRVEERRRLAALVLALEEAHFKALEGSRDHAHDYDGVDKAYCEVLRSTAWISEFFLPTRLPAR